MTLHHCVVVDYTLERMFHGPEIRCSLCRVIKPATPDFFFPRADRPGSFYPYCRPCWNAKRNANRLVRATAMNRRCACGCGQLLLHPGTRFVAGHFKPCGMLGKTWSAPPSAEPSHIDIVWAAGVYEGEGSCSLEGSVSVPQKDPWLVIKLRDFFGGKVSHDGLIWHWYASGERARTFLESIYQYLSPRRKERIDEYLAEIRRLRNQFPESEWVPRKKRPRKWPSGPRPRRKPTKTKPPSAVALRANEATDRPA